MRKIVTIVGVATLALGVAACGKGGGNTSGGGNISEADNMLVPADEGTGNAGTDNATADANMTADNASAGNAQ